MKITQSLLATTVVAMENAVDAELTALFQGCASVVNSPTFDGKHRPRLSDQEWHAKWTVKCTKYGSKLSKAWDRCGEPTSGYNVAFTKNVVTETCEAVSELATQNIEWMNAHILTTAPNCQRRLEKMTDRINIWEGKLKKILDCAPAKPEPAIGYIVPKDWEYFDYYYDHHEEGSNEKLLWPDYFDFGDEIHFSTRCTNDFNFSTGKDIPEYWQCLMTQTHIDSGKTQEAWDEIVRGNCFRTSPRQLLRSAILDPKDPTKFLTYLNCPQCGCTGGDDSTDVPLITDERVSG